MTDNTSRDRGAIDLTPAGPAVSAGDREAFHRLLQALEHPAARRLLVGFMRAHMRELHGVMIDERTLLERLADLPRRQRFIDALLNVV